MKDGTQNVLVLATTFPRWKDDITPKFVYELSKEIDRDSNKVVVLCPHHPDSKIREEMSGLKIYRYPYFFPLQYQALRDGSMVEKVQKSHLAKIQVPLLILSLALHTIWLVRKENIDVINSHWILPNGVIGSLVNHFFSVPHVMTIHAGGALMLDKLPLNTYLASYAHRHSDSITSVSTHIRETFEKLIHDNKDEMKDIIVQPMGTHTSAFDEFNEQNSERKKEKQNNTIGLYVGRLAKKKGVEYLLEAASILDGKYDEFRLVIVGTGPLEEELYTKTEALGIEDTVEFTGWVSETELNKWYVDADFVTVPSIETETGDTEGMPTVISEALAASNPVIATDVGGIPDVVNDRSNGYIVDQRCPDQLADRMARFLKDETLLQTMSDEAVATSKTLDWEYCGETYTELLSDACDGE